MTTFEYRLFIFAVIASMTAMLLYLSIIAGFAHSDTVSGPFHSVGSAAFLAFAFLRIKVLLRLKKV